MRRLAFGTTPWGAYFIDAMEALADTGRLDRGRSYASNGKVKKLAVERGEAVAKVEGSYQPFYRVRLTFPLLDEESRAKLATILSEDPLSAGRILAGEIPQAFLERLQAEGIRLLPRRWSDMERSCDCPDSGDPCKHMAAVYYTLAREIDRDPLVLFRLCGADVSGMTAAEAGPALGAPSVTEPLPWVAATAWPAPAEREFQPPGVSSFASTIPRFLPPAPAIASRDLRSCLAEFYHRAAIVSDAPLATEAGDGSEIRERRWARASYSLHLPERPGAGRPRIIVEVPDEGKAELTPFELCRIFSAFEGSAGTSAYRFLRALSLSARILCANQAFVPGVRCDGRALSIVWKPALFAADVRALLAELSAFAIPLDSGEKKQAADAPPKRGRPRKTAARPDAASTILILLSDLLGDFVRFLGYLPSPPSFAAEPACRALFLGETIAVDSPAMRSLPKALDSWLSVFDLASSRFGYGLVLKERKDGSFSLGATVRTEADAERAMLDDGLALNEAVGLHGPEVLRFPAMLSSFIPRLEDLSSKGAVRLGMDEAADFILESAPLLARLGVTVTLPRSLRTLVKPRAVIVGERKKQGSLLSFLPGRELLSFHWRAAIGEETIDAAEFATLLEADSRLVRFRGTWIRLDPDEAASVMARLMRKDAIGAPEALAAYLSDESSFSPDLCSLFDGFLSKASGMDKKALPPPAGLKARFRPYQERGYRWLAAHQELGMGCLLADDMGLGKTLQAIALILHLKETGRLSSGALVCVPAGLLGNWERELSSFAPSLSVVTYYGAARTLKRGDVVLTSYETFTRDAEKIANGPLTGKTARTAATNEASKTRGSVSSKASAKVETGRERGDERRAWDLLVLDEAHGIKNPDAKRARAVKSARARGRIALTGTPVENHLGEFWSIFDFIMPGYLGNPTAFMRTFRRPIEVERNREAAERLTRLTAPFILRRLKTDPAIAAELPEKLVIDEYAGLTVEQASLYQSVVADAAERLSSSKGAEKRALMLQLLTRLKQICNHPRNFDKESPPAPERSGKAILLLALLESAMEAGEKVLVFSQFVEMLAILEGILTRDLGIAPFLLHGGLAKEKRDAAVEAFQSAQGPAVFLISLKAGGVGLNLTAATRVVHYDLWFNPAVENQATDRAYRIGQKKNVFVHRLITRDSFEEKIDRMIKAKTELAELTVKAGETWLADLEPEEIRELLSLGKA